MTVSSMMASSADLSSKRSLVFNPTPNHSRGRFTASAHQRSNDSVLQNRQRYSCRMELSCDWMGTQMFVAGEPMRKPLPAHSPFVIPETFSLRTLHRNLSVVSNSLLLWRASIQVHVD